MADIPKPKSNFDAVGQRKFCPLCQLRITAYQASRHFALLQAVDIDQATHERLHAMCSGGLAALPALLRKSRDNMGCEACQNAERASGANVPDGNRAIKVLP